jgi:hypothetical protein
MSNVGDRWDTYNYVRQEFYSESNMQVLREKIKQEIHRQVPHVTNFKVDMKDVAHYMQRALLTPYNDVNQGVRPLNDRVARDFAQDYVQGIRGFEHYQATVRRPVFVNRPIATHVNKGPTASNYALRADLNQHVGQPDPNFRKY